MRWVQRLNEETGKYEFIPVDDAARQNSMGLAIHGDIKAFVSPVDGSVISDRKGLREHNKRNNVVNLAETEGVKPPQAKDDSFEKKRVLYEAITRAERSN
jgi:hypothetical protein